MSTLLAQRSLVDHVAAVAAGLRAGLAEGRRAVALIVGRDPDRLDAAGVGRAAVESLAENLSDGVVAPLFWGVVAGLPGMLAYKAVNTLDSMVGHHSERYRDFGWASARFDDLVNLVPARLTGAALCLVGGAPRALGLPVMLRDAPRHRSPNAGWPEAAMAAALGLRLAGPRVYGGARSRTPGWATAAPRSRPPTSTARIAPGLAGLVAAAGRRALAAASPGASARAPAAGRGRGSARDARRARPAPPRPAPRRPGRHPPALGSAPGARARKPSAARMPCR